MAELEGGYFVSELNGHPVHYVGGERGFHEWGDVYLGNSEISYLVYIIFGEGSE